MILAWVSPFKKFFWKSEKSKQIEISICGIHYFIKN